MRRVISVFAVGLLILLFRSVRGSLQSARPRPTPSRSSATSCRQPSARGRFVQWEGLTVRHIAFEGVDAERLAPLPDHLAQAVGRRSIRRILLKACASCLRPASLKPLPSKESGKETAWRSFFKGEPRTFIGTVSVDGAKGAT